MKIEITYIFKDEDTKDTIAAYEIIDWNNKVYWLWNKNKNKVRWIEGEKYIEELEKYFKNK